VGRYYYACIECGTGKPIGKAKRCTPCNTGYYAAMREANAAITLAKSRGLPKASAHACVDCGAQAFDYDHRDYRKPLEIEPVCRSCNIKRGPALWARPAGPGTHREGH